MVWKQNKAAAPVISGVNFFYLHIKFKSKTAQINTELNANGA